MSQKREREKGDSYTSYWKHKRPYGKRATNKKLRRKAKGCLGQRVIKFVNERLV